MPRVLLIHPYADPLKSLSIVPSLGLGYIASSLRAKGHHVDIVDCLQKGIKPPALLGIIEDKRPDIIGITIFSLFFLEAKKTIDLIKERFNIPVVVGGPHVSSLPELTLKECRADYAVIGEGEITITELVDAISSVSPKLNRIKGIGYRENGAIRINERRDLIEDLDTIPFPAWDLIMPETYPPITHGTFYKRFPIAPIVTTRGCPFICTFCASDRTWGRLLRKRSPKNVVDEMELLMGEHGIREFHHEDDNLTVSKEHAMGICQEIINRKLNISWSCPNGVRIDCLDRELLAMMKKSGCYMVALGIESGDQGILDRAQKKLDLSKVPVMVEMVKDAGIDVMGFFILGLPGETMETARKTIEFAKSLPIDSAKFHNFIPLPGTSVFDEWYQRRGGNIDWGEISLFGKAAYSTESLSSKELTELQKQAHREFYLRPSIFLKNILKIKPRQITWLVGRFLKIFFGL